MIKKKNDQVIEKREHMRGGSGEVTIRHYFKKDEINAACRLCAEMTIPPGGSIGLHDHIEEDEIYIVQKGNGIITDGDTDVDVGVGDAILTGRGGTHSVKNSGTTDLCITAIIMQYKKS